MSPLDELFFDLIEDAIDSATDDEILECATDKDLRDAGEVRRTIKETIEKCIISQTLRR